jgi:hypothetical protein
MNAFLTWASARLSEASTWIGFASLASAAGVHIAVAPSTLNTVATVIAGLVGAGLVAVTTKNPAPVIAEVVKDVPEVIEAVANTTAH